MDDKLIDNSLGGASLRGDDKLFLMALPPAGPCLREQAVRLVRGRPYCSLQRESSHSACPPGLLLEGFVLWVQVTRQPALETVSHGVNSCQGPSSKSEVCSVQLGGSRYALHMEDKHGLPQLHCADTGPLILQGRCRQCHIKGGQQGPSLTSTFCYSGNLVPPGRS